jgi:hypothetical protein
MLTRLWDALFANDNTCEACGEYEATQGFLCVYCHLDDKLAIAAQGFPTKPSRPFPGELDA